LIALAVSAALAPGAAKAPARSPWLAGLQYSIPNMSFADCQRESFPNLRAEGLTSQYRGPSRSWYGRSPGDTSATIFCYEGANGLVWVTIVAADSSNGPRASRTALNLLHRFHGTGGGPVAPGTYSVVSDYPGATYPGTAILNISGGHLTGTIHFGCCPGDRTDPIDGTVNGDEFTFTRDCSGEGGPSGCSQTWTGKTTGPGSIRGQSTGTGGTGTFVFTKVG
jgi:hypothetical protein